jgi:hypothetical protein
VIRVQFAKSLAGMDTHSTTNLGQKGGGYVAPFLGESLRLNHDTLQDHCAVFLIRLSSEKSQGISMSLIFLSLYFHVILSH